MLTERVGNRESGESGRTGRARAQGERENGE